MIGTIINYLGIVLLWIWKNIFWVSIKLIFNFIFYFVTFRWITNRGEINDEINYKKKKKGSDLTVKEVGKVLVDDVKKVMPNTKTNSFDREVADYFKSMKKNVKTSNKNRKKKRAGKKKIKQNKKGA